MVERQIIETIRTETADCSEDVLEREFEEFFKNQLAVCNFVMDLTSTRNHSAGELALYMSYVVYKAILLDRDGSLGPVTSEEIADACRASGDWVHRMSDAEETGVQSPSLSNLNNERCLISYVISEVHDALKGGLDLKEEEKGAVFFVLTAVIASLTASSN